MKIAEAIDHTLLKPEATEEQIRVLCLEATQHRFAAACVNSCWVPLVSDLLKGSPVKTCSVVGFPLGSATSETKAYETKQAIAAGADEIDMVINIGWLKSGKIQEMLNDIAAVRQAAPAPVILKVIIESAILTDNEIRTVSEVCVNEHADFVKTSTGMHAGGGARVEHVRLIKAVIGDRARIKASGGIRTYGDAIKFLEAGASRLGCSSSVQIVQEASCQRVA